MTAAAPLACTVRGNGPLVLMLHGIGASRTAWDKQIARLEPLFTCVAPDLPGYGDSPDLAERGLSPIVDAIAEMLAGRSAHVIAVSFGALAALALARSHPALVRSLILADATLGRAHGSAEERRRWLDLRRALAADLADRSEARAAEIAAPEASPEIVAEIARHMRRARPEGYLAVAEAIAATDARPWLKDIRQPALVVCGEHDGVTGLGVSTTLAETLPGARLVLIASAGHAPHIEQPDRFAAEVLSFLGGDGNQHEQAEHPEAPSDGVRAPTSLDRESTS